MPRDSYLPLKPAPGAWRNGSRYEANGRWYDVNLVRWSNGRLRPVGGWQRFTTDPFSMPIRGLHAWRSNTQARWLAGGSAAGLFVHDGTQLLDITPLGFAVGRGNSVYGLGWGAGKYGLDAYGTVRTSSGIVLDAATWSIANFGEVLIGSSTGDGRIYEWAPLQAGMGGDSARATVLAGAPIDVAYVFVTDERHVVALGTTHNPRKVSWSSRENRTLWTPDDLNTAGDLDVTTAGKLMAAARWRGDYLLFTDCDVHLMTYKGSPLIYGVQPVSDNNGLVGPGAVVATTNHVAWMSTSGFWAYDGVAKPLDCDVQEYVFKDINMLQGSKIAAGHNSNFSEVWWFYPSANSVENDRYVIWNYKEDWWSFGELARTAWLDKGAWTHVVGASPESHLYQHEDGWTDSGTSRAGRVYAESGSIELGRGERFTEVRQLIPDDCEDENCVAISFNLRENPRSEPFAVAGPYGYGQANGFMDARFAAREIEMRVEATRDGDFHIGTLRADIVQGSGR